MLTNKICVTERGLDFLNEDRKQIQVQQFNLLHARKASLPILRGVRSPSSLSKHSKVDQKLSKNQNLCRLTLQLETLQKMGLKKLLINKQDKMLNALLVQQMRNKQKYFNKIIPFIVKKTRDPRRTNNLGARFLRSCAYTQRLQQDHQPHKKFGMGNNVKRSKVHSREV